MLHEDFTVVAGTATVAIIAIAVLFAPKYWCIWATECKEFPWINFIIIMLLVTIKWANADHAPHEIPGGRACPTALAIQAGFLP